MQGVVPIIDLSTPTAAQRLGDACRDAGFFQIIGHGVDVVVAERAWTMAKAFFDQPDEVRMDVAMPHPGYPYGYQPYAVERLASSAGDTTPPDRKHTYSIGPIDDVSHSIVDPDEVWIRSPNRWPSSPPLFQETMELYYRAMGDLCGRVMTLMATALDLQPSFFDTFISAHTSAVRLLDYPHSDEPPLPGQLRAGAHTDYGTTRFFAKSRNLVVSKYKRPTGRGSRLTRCQALTWSTWVIVSHVGPTIVGGRRCIELSIHPSTHRGPRDVVRSPSSTMRIGTLRSNASLRASQMASTRDTHPC